MRRDRNERRQRELFESDSSDHLPWLDPATLEDRIKDIGDRCRGIQEVFEMMSKCWNAEAYILHALACLKELEEIEVVLSQMRYELEEQQNYLLIKYIDRVKSIRTMFQPPLEWRFGLIRDGIEDNFIQSIRPLLVGKDPGLMKFGSELSLAKLRVSLEASTTRIKHLCEFILRLCRQIIQSCPEDVFASLLEDSCDWKVEIEGRLSSFRQDLRPAYLERELNNTIDEILVCDFMKQATKDDVIKNEAELEGVRLEIAAFCHFVTKSSEGLDQLDKWGILKHCLRCGFDHVDEFLSLCIKYSDLNQLKAEYTNNDDKETHTNTTKSHDVFDSREAKVYWDRLVEKGLLKADHQLSEQLSNNDAAYIAMKFNEKLRPGKRNSWGYFECLWNKKKFSGAGCTKGEFPKKAREIDAIFDPPQ